MYHNHLIVNKKIIIVKYKFWNVESPRKSPFTRGLPYVAISRVYFSPIRTDHFITDKFKVENDTITTFYKNLKIKFNTDEEI